MPATVLAMTTDLFTQSRISEITNNIGLEASFITNQEELVGAIKSVRPKLTVLDLSTNDYDPFTIATMLKQRFPSLKILGFYPHVKTELKTRAENSGVDYIVPNSKFATSLRTILMRLKNID